MWYNLKIQTYAEWKRKLSMIEYIQGNEELENQYLFDKYEVSVH